jgi:hypothetical protein
MPAIKSVEFVRNRKSLLSYHCSERSCPTEDKIDDVKDSFYGELERVFYKFPEYHMKLLLEKFNAKVVRGDIFQSKVGYQSVHEINHGNGIE